VSKDREKAMEPMVVCALGIVVCCGYLTVKDIVTDLHQEVFLARPLFTGTRNGTKVELEGVTLRGALVRRGRGLPRGIRKVVNARHWCLKRNGTKTRLEPLCPWVCSTKAQRLVRG
jgi:hypothetical protein